MIGLPGYSPITASVNLGIKAIIGLMAASQIATIIGDDADATTWSDAATDNVGPWISLSTDAIGRQLSQPRTRARPVPGHRSTTPTTRW